MEFIGTRSSVYGTHGMVASSQPLASEIGLRILKQGGNAVDAAIAIAAALNVTEPCSTGIGGDCFLLFYDAKDKQVYGLNGSGRSAKALSLEKAKKDIGSNAHHLPNDHGHSVTVPGAVAGWIDAIENWGSLTPQEILDPAIQLATEGFPVSSITSHFWQKGVVQLQRGPHANELLIDGRAPKAGEIFKNPYLAQCFQEIASKGKSGFYEGRIAEAIIDIVQSKGGALTLEDLKEHTSTFVDPIKTQFKGVDVYEIPPNGQGITALLALNLLEQVLPSNETFDDHAKILHLQIEALRLAFADAKWYVSDLDVNAKLPIDALLGKKYAEERAKLINPSHAAIDPKRGSPELSCDTVSFQVVDAAGNAVSMVNSNYEHFGTGFIPFHCGFTLQNRGCNFVLHDVTHPNILAPHKRPYHTIIPAITTFADSRLLHSTFTVMGGFMQPQGHVQMLVNMLCHGMNPQQALDAPRFCIDAHTDAEKEATSRIFVEDTMNSAFVDKLKTFGHVIEVLSGYKRCMFGRGQIILKDPQSGVLCAGSDGRADGCAMGW